MKPSDHDENRVARITFLKVKIFNIMKRTNIVFNKFDHKYDLLFGLDTIPQFHLNLDFNLNSSQTPEIQTYSNCNPIRVINDDSKIFD